MNITKKPEIDTNLLVINPFIVNNKITTRTINKEEILTKNRDGINYVEGSLKQQVLLDDKAFTKVFQEVGYRDIIMGLSHNGLLLFNWITFTLNVKEDYIWINHTLFMKKVYIRRKEDYNTAVTELIRYGILATSLIEGVYWVNPFIIFCGNRLEKYPNNLITRE